MAVTDRTGRSLSVKPENKLAFTQTLSYNRFNYASKEARMRTDNTSGQFVREKTKPMNLVVGLLVKVF